MTMDAAMHSMLCCCLIMFFIALLMASINFKLRFDHTKEDIPMKNNLSKRSSNGQQKNPPKPNPNKPVCVLLVVV